MTLPQAMAALADRDRELARRDEELARKDRQIAELARAVESTTATVASLQHQIEQYLRRLYGPRSEKYDPKQLLPDPILLPSGNAPAAPPPAPEVPVPEWPAKPARRHTPHGRLPIPEHLERIDILLDIPESEKLEFRPGRLFVNVFRRPKYASPDRAQDWKVGVVTAPMPDHPIDKCKADVGLIAHIIVSKFCDHLPLYRQDDIFAREGVTIPRNTQDGWVLQTADAIQLLGGQLKATVLDTDVVFTDDSPIPLLEPGRGRVRQARLWAYVRGGTDPPLTGVRLHPGPPEDPPAGVPWRLPGLCPGRCLQRVRRAVRQARRHRGRLLDPRPAQVRRGDDLPASGGHRHAGPHRPALRSRGAGPRHDAGATVRPSPEARASGAG